MSEAVFTMPQNTPKENFDAGVKALSYIKDPANAADYPDSIRYGGRAKEGFEYFREAAYAGHTAAQYNVAQCYHYGIGTKKDAAKAKEYLEKAVLKDHAPAKLLLGKIIMSGDDITAADKTRALDLAIDASKRVWFPWGTGSATVSADDVGSLMATIMKHAQQEVTGNSVTITFPERNEPKPQAPVPLQVVPKG